MPSDEDIPNLDNHNSSVDGTTSFEWTEEDQICLDCTYDWELSLWRRTKTMFNCAPLDLFPYGVKAASDHWDGYQYEGRHIKNETSLTIPLSKSLCTLVCFPYFDGDVSLVKYALTTALKARCGDKAPIINEGSDGWTRFETKCKDLFEQFENAGLSFELDQINTMKDVLSMQFNFFELPQYGAFVDLKIFKEALASTRTAKEKGDSIHLLNGDIQTIIKGWDI